MSEGSLIDRIREQVDSLTPEEVRAQYAQLQEQRAKGLEKSKVRRENRSPEQIERDKQRSKQYLQTDAAKERAKAYREREDVKVKTKERAAIQREKVKLLLARAAELGL